MTGAEGNGRSATYMGPIPVLLRIMGRVRTRDQLSDFSFKLSCFKTGKNDVRAGQKRGMEKRLLASDGEETSAAGRTAAVSTAESRKSSRKSPGKRPSAGRRPEIRQRSCPSETTGCGNQKGDTEKDMEQITGYTELVGLMAYPIRHTQSPATQIKGYRKIGVDAVQLAFEVDNHNLKDAIQAIRALKMLGSNISMPNKTVVLQYLDEIEETARMCGSVNTVVNTRDEQGKVTGYLKGYNTDGMGYWRALRREAVDYEGMKMVLIGSGGAASAIAVEGASQGISEIHMFNRRDQFYSRGETLAQLICSKTGCRAEIHDLEDRNLLKSLMDQADLFCDATGVGMHPLEEYSNIPDPTYFHPELVVTDTVYSPKETVMIRQARQAGCTRVYNGFRMMLYQAAISIWLYTGKKVPVGELERELELDGGQENPFRTP